MKVAIWIWKYVPFAAFIWFKIIFRLLSGFISTIEAIWWWRAGRQAREVLPMLRESIKGTDELLNWYTDCGFTWRSDPWGGVLDYHSRPWVSVAKKYGDCDDMAGLAYYIFKGKFLKAIRVISYSTTGEGHVVLMLKVSETLWVCVSNKAAATFRFFDEGVRSTYGFKTAFWYTF